MTIRAHWDRGNRGGAVPVPDPFVHDPMLLHMVQGLLQEPHRRPSQHLGDLLDYRHGFLRDDDHRVQVQVLQASSVHNPSIHRAMGASDDPLVAWVLHARVASGVTPSYGDLQSPWQTNPCSAPCALCAPSVLPRGDQEYILHKQQEEEHHILMNAFRE